MKSTPQGTDVLSCARTKVTYWVGPVFGHNEDSSGDSIVLSSVIIYSITFMVIFFFL